jgi:hypothetical protein
MANNDGIGLLPRFDKSYTRAEAYAARTSEPETIFFTTVDHRIMINGEEYGGNTSTDNRVTTLEGQVSSTAANAQAAAQSADQASQSAQNAESTLAALQTAIQSLPSGSDVSAAVALMKNNKVEIVDLRSIGSGDTIRDSFNTAIEAGKCHFVYGNGDQSSPRYFACEVNSFTYNSTYYTVAKFKVGSSSGDDHEYRYWVFTKNASYDMWQCSALYNESNVPSYIKENLASEIVKTKANKPSSSTNNHIATLDGSGNLKDSGIGKDDVLLEAFKVVSIGNQGTFSGTYPVGTYTIDETQASNLSGTLYATLNAIWTAKKIPVIVVSLANHTASFVIPLYKDSQDKFKGHERGDNGDYSVDVEIGSSAGTIKTKAIGSYDKPSGGIPKTDLASAVQTSLERADDALLQITDEDLDEIFPLN